MQVKVAGLNKPKDNKDVGGKLSFERSFGLTTIYCNVDRDSRIVT